MSRLAADNQSRILRRMQHQKNTCTKIWLTLLAILYITIAATGFEWRLHDSPDSNGGGGMFSYPVAFLHHIAAMFGATSDLTLHKIARAYAATWGLVGIALMFAVGRRLGGAWTGLLSATLFVLLPVVVCASHDGSPRLPVAVAILFAVWFTMRALDRQKFRDWIGMFVSCGACVAMSLGAMPILLLIPVAIGLHCRHQHLRQVHELPTCSNRHVDYRPVFLRASGGGLLVAGLVFALTNPGIVRGIFTGDSNNNFGDSLSIANVVTVPQRLIPFAMFSIDGATIPVLILGFIAAIIAITTKRHAFTPVLVCAGLVSIEILLIDSSRSVAYERYTIFYQLALSLGSAWLIVWIAQKIKPLGLILGFGICAWCGVLSAELLQDFRIDAGAVMDSVRSEHPSVNSSGNPTGNRP